MRLFNYITFFEICQYTSCFLCDKFRFIRELFKCIMTKNEAIIKKAAETAAASRHFA